MCFDKDLDIFFRKEMVNSDHIVSILISALSYAEAKGCKQMWKMGGAGTTVATYKNSLSLSHLYYPMMNDTI